MARHNVAPLQEERAFQIHELFFSTTDGAGVIRSGNDVFRRVAAFGSLEELIGKPHNIIRHPDMPRVVFKLLWDTIEAGKPIGAYVKNMAKTGAYYWVFALVMPIDGGYLSVRFKPSSPIFEIVRQLYAEMLKVEAGYTEPKMRNLGMEKSGEVMMAALQSLGFETYDDFMRCALATEFDSRAKQIVSGSTVRVEGGGELGVALRRGHELDSTLESMFGRVDSFLELIGKLEARADTLSELSSKIRLLAFNSLIACQKMDNHGMGLGVVAENLSEISNQTTESTIKMTEGIHLLIGGLREISFQICASKLQAEMSIVFLNELVDRGCEEEDQHFKDLHDLSSYFAITSGCLREVLPRLREPVSKLRYLMKGLDESVRCLARAHMIGRVEAAHVEGAETFLQLFAEIAEQVQKARVEILEFSNAILVVEKGLPILEEGSRQLSERNDVVRP